KSTTAKLHGRPSLESGSRAEAAAPARTRCDPSHSLVCLSCATVGAWEAARWSCRSDERTAMTTPVLKDDCENAEPRLLQDEELGGVSGGLVVIAIMETLVGLLLPAVNSA